MVTILDNDAVISVVQIADAAEPATQGRFQFSRLGSVEAILVYYTVSGSATGGTHYQTLIGSVLFPAHLDVTATQTVDVEVIPIDDAVANAPRTVVVTLLPSRFYTPHQTDYNARVTIADDDGGGPDPGLSGNLTAFRPQTLNLTQVPVPEAQEDTASEGAGIRRNGDDDDGDDVADRVDPNGVAGEDDLIPVHLNISHTAQQLADGNRELLLRRSNTHINVWSGANRMSGLLTDQDQAVITVLTGVGMVHVEWVSMNLLPNESYLDLLVRDKTTLQVTVLDRVRFYPFTSIVIGFVGEFQSPRDPTTGMHQMVTRLYNAGYDARIYDEDDVGYDTPQGFRPAPEQAAHNAVYNAVEYQGVQEVALFGYSHGGGAVYNLSTQLANDWNRDNSTGDGMPGNRLVFTAYIDAVAKRSGFSQTNRPVDSQYHYNIYQELLDGPTDLVSGGNMGAAADVNENVEDAAGNIHRPDAVHGYDFRRGIAEMADVQDAVLGLRPGWPQGLTKRVKR